MSQEHVFLAEHEGIYVLKLEGVLRFDISSAVDVAIKQILQAPDLDSVLVDLSAAENIDSTVLGLLAQIAVGLSECLQAKPVILASSDDIIKILTNVGFEKVFIIVKSGFGFEQSFKEIMPLDEGEQFLAKRVLEAHSTLMSLNKQNQHQFQKVVDTLQDQLAAKPPHY